jgi:hypothetical protein
VELVDGGLAFGIDSEGKVDAIYWNPYLKKRAPPDKVKN